MTGMVFLKVATRQLYLQGQAAPETTTDSTSHGHSGEGRAQGSRWKPVWLEDADRLDPYVLGHADPNCSWLPEFQSGFFGSVRNRLRMSLAGIPFLEGDVEDGGLEAGA
jgi:hypothetical protein